jgi:hypothetical protein
MTKLKLHLSALIILIALAGCSAKKPDTLATDVSELPEGALSAPEIGGVEISRRPYFDNACVDAVCRPKTASDFCIEERTFKGGFDINKGWVPPTVWCCWPAKAQGTSCRPNRQLCVGKCNGKGICSCRAIVPH